MSTATPPGDGPGEGPEEPREGQAGQQPAEPVAEPGTGQPSEPSAGQPSDAAGGQAPAPAPGAGGVDVDAAWAQIMAHWNEPAVDPGTRSPARPGKHRRADGHAGSEPPAGPEVPPHELRRRRTDRPASPPAAQGPSSFPPPPSGQASGQVSGQAPGQPPAQPRRAPRAEGERPSLPDGRGGTESDPLADEHYVPPDPPPLPRGSWRTWLPWVGVLGVPLFFVVVVVLRPSLPSEVVLVAVLGFVAGFLTLVLRLPDHRDDDGDDGARV